MSNTYSNNPDAAFKTEVFESIVSGSIWAQRYDADRGEFLSFSDHCARDWNTANFTLSYAWIIQPDGTWVDSRTGVHGASIAEMNDLFEIPTGVIRRDLAVV